MSRMLIAASLLLVGVAAPAAAQDWRTLTTRRQQAGEARLTVDLEFGAGTLKVQRAPAGTLYSAQLRYDADGFQPVHVYENGRLRIGVEGSSSMRRGIKEGGRLDLDLGGETELDANFKFGAVDAEIELGGLKLRRTRISTGASDTRVRFSQPNAQRMDSLTLEVGAASFLIAGLGNANVDRLKLSGGVGGITLDFSGAWNGTTHAEVSMGVGSVTLRIPRGLGVQVERSTFLVSFDPEGMIKRGNAYFTPNWDESKQRLILRIDGALGAVNVRWIN